MRILITGATGFIGSYLAEFLADKGEEIWGTYYVDEDLKQKRFNGHVNLVKCDIRNANAVHDTIARVKPERIYHLAAQSFPTVSWKKPALTFETNVIGTINIFESVIRQGFKPKVLVACSSAEYGFVSESEGPVNEDHPLKPLHPYGVSKVAKDLLAYQYFINFGIPVVRVRIFNTTGPGKVNDVCSDFARRIADINKGKSPMVLKVGNLETKRDITDVRDAVKALHLALEKGEMGDVYNLSSGRAYQISELLDILLNLDGTGINVEVAPELLRPSDEPIIIGANAKLHRQTGWKPNIHIETTLEDTLNYWRQT